MHFPRCFTDGHLFLPLRTKKGLGLVRSRLLHDAIGTTAFSDGVSMFLFLLSWWMGH
jgi:hypothetical protein